MDPRELTGLTAGAPARPVDVALADADRLAAVAATGLFDTAPEREFDRLTRLASRALGAPVAITSLIDRTRQFYKSCVGLPPGFREVAVEDSFCRYVVARGAPLAIEDARTVPELREKPAVLSGLAVGYLGAPLTTPAGEVIGTLCAVTPEPRAWSAEDVAVIEDLAAAVVTEISLRLEVTALRETEIRLEAAIDRADAAVALHDRVLETAHSAYVRLDESGRVTGWNAAAEQTFGHAREAAIGCDLAELVIPRRHRAAHRAGLRRFRTTGATDLADAPHQLSALRADGSEFPVEMTVAAVRQAGTPSFHAFIRDISDARAAEADRGLLAAIVASTRDAVLSTDREGRVTSWNAGAERLYGYREDEMLGRTTGLLAGDAAAAAAQRSGLERALSGESFIESAVARRHRDGRPIRVDLSRAPLRDAEGRVTGVSFVSRDVTREHELGLALADAEARFRRAFDEAPSGIALVTPDGRFAQVNPTFCAIVGRAREELIGLAAEAITHPEDRGASANMRRGVVDGEVGSGRQGYVLEKRYLHADGHPVWVEVSASLMQSTGDRAGYLITHITDISARRQAEAELAQARAEIDRFFALSPELMAIMDTDGRFVRVNPAWSATLGWSSGELTGSSWLDFVHPQDVPATLAAMARQNDGEEVRQFENRLRARDGSYRRLQWNASAPQDTGVVFATARDVTERHDLERQLRERTDEALAASRAKSEFVANMSHEIRTPLNGVVSMAELLLDTELDDEQRRYAQVTATSAHALTRVIDDILDFSKIEAGKLEILDEDYELEATVAAVCDIVGVRARAKGLELAFELAPDLPAVLRGDSGRLRQILLNLIGNAVKFTAAGEVLVRGERVRDASGAPWIRLTVSDTGIGIGEAALARLFQPFQQADATTTRRFGGTGLGLSIAKQLVELMDGRIGASSTPGAGSTFWFELPCVPGKPTDAPREGLVESVLTKPISRARLSDALVGMDAETWAPPAPLAIDPRPPGTGATRVLVAEDNEINQFIAVRVLEKLGYAVDVVGNGRDAIEAASGGRYAAIFMDCQMPEVDGYRATQEIRRREGDLRHMPIVAMTASTMAGDRERCLAAGMDDYLPKPLPFDRLAEVCRRLVSPAAPVMEPPLFDAGRLGAVAAPEQVEEVLAIFLEQLAVSLADLAVAATDEDRSRLDAVAHRLAGSAATVGAITLTRACQALTAAAATAGADELGRLHRELAAVAAETRSAIAERRPAAARDA